MEIEIIGSGGCVSLPRPLCQCGVCIEAREKGRPYARHGCAIFLHDINMLIDTPEDIVYAINSSSIEKIDCVMYSHLDPDHTLGFRVFEQLRLNWFDVSEGRECNNPIDVYAMDHVMKDLNEIKSVYGGFLDYYEGVRKLIVRKPLGETFTHGDIKITLIKIERSTIFVFESNNKKVIYAPCDVKPFPDEAIFMEADYLIIGDTIIGEVLKNGYVLAKDNSLRHELFVMDEIIAIKERYKIDQVIMTHIEEDWGKSYDDYLQLEKEYEGIKFAYDGMSIQV